MRPKLLEGICQAGEETARLGELRHIDRQLHLAEAILDSSLADVLCPVYYYDFLWHDREANDLLDLGVSDAVLLIRPARAEVPRRTLVTVLLSRQVSEHLDALICQNKQALGELSVLHRLPPLHLPLLVLVRDLGTQPLLSIPVLLGVATRRLAHV